MLTAPHAITSIDTHQILDIIISSDLMWKKHYNSILADAYTAPSSYLDVPAFSSTVNIQAREMFCATSSYT